MWGAADRIIPVAHAHAAAERMPGSGLELFERSGHFPHEAEPRRFARVLSEFIASTEPADVRATAAILRRP